MKHRTFYVSGIAQVAVRAPNAVEAVKRAKEIAEKRGTKALYIELDNITESGETGSGEVVALIDADELD